MDFLTTHIFTRSLLRFVPFICVALVGMRQLRRRWSRNREAAALVNWGLGLLILHFLVTVVFTEYQIIGRLRYDEEPVLLDRLLRFYFDCLYLLVYSYIIWSLYRGAVVLLDSTGVAEARLTSAQVRALLPVVRVSKRFIGREEMEITESEVLFRRVRRDGARSEPVRRIELKDASGMPAPGLQVVIEQVGLVGPERHLRRFRFVGPGLRRSFAVPVSDFSHVRDVLEELLPGRVTERERPRRSLGDWILLVLAILFFVMILADDYRLLPGVAGMPLLYVLVLGPVAVLLVYFAQGLTALFSKNRPALPTLRVPRRPSRYRLPQHSKLLGWSVKVGALLFTIWWLGSPALERWASETQGDRASLLFVLLGVVSVSTMTLGQRWCQPVFAPGSHQDPRPPFLFLRSFADDDRKTLQPNTWLARLFGIPPDFGWRGNRRSVFRAGMQFHPIRLVRIFLGRLSDTVEELLALGLRGSGPLVAIGKPGESLTTSGAHRMYVTDEAWQSVVQGYLASAAGVVLQPAQTEAVLWELRKTLETVPRTKVLLCMVNYQNRPQAFEDFWLLLREEFGVELPRDIPFLDRPSFVFFDAQGTAYLQPVIYYPVWIWPIEGNAVDVQATLAPYLSSLQSNEPSEPVTPQASNWVEILFAILLAGIFVFLIPFGMRLLSRAVMALIPGS